MTRYETPMIFKRAPRVLPDGCLHCGLSAVYCGCHKSLNNGLPCCERCRHEDGR